MTYSQVMTTYLGSGTHAARPATPNVAAGVAPVYYETDTSHWFGWTGSAWSQIDVGGGSSLYSAYLYYQDQKASGTTGGTFTSGAWRTRDINTEVVDTGNNGSVASNQITLAAGTYDCLIMCPAYGVDRHAARLQNITGSTTLLSGTAPFSTSANATESSSVIQGRFTLGSSTVLEIQHRCQTTQSSFGFGVDAGTSFTVATEIYTTASFYKV